MLNTVSRRRPPSLIDRFFSDLRDALLDTAEGIIDDAESVFRTKFTPPATTNPPHTPHPGKQSRSNRSRAKNPTSKPGRGTKTSPGASQAQLMTWYGVLGVQDYAPVEVIQAAYKAMARIHHPDTGGDTKRMTEINTAYEVLSDPKKRREYDRQIGLAR